MNNLIQQLVQQLLPACKNATLAEQEAWWLLEAATNKSQSELLSSHLTPSQQELDRLATLIAQRVHEHKPLQYILGTTPFCGLTIKVRPPILIPRPETEEWTTWLIDTYKKAGMLSFTALDLCTGSGCIGLALAQHFPRATVVGTDLSTDAIALANENKCILNLNNITFIASDLYTTLPPTFTCNLIVSNPPYLSSAEYESLDTDVRTWENRSALVGGQDGMFFYRAILQQAHKFLRPHPPPWHMQLPNVVLEIGCTQDTQLEQLMATMNITQYIIHEDLEGKRRWVAINV